MALCADRGVDQTRRRPRRLRVHRRLGAYLSLRRRRARRRPSHGAGVGRALGRGRRLVRLWTRRGTPGSRRSDGLGRHRRRRGARLCRRGACVSCWLGVVDCWCQPYRDAPCRAATAVVARGDSASAVGNHRGIRRRARSGWRAGRRRGRRGEQFASRSRRRDARYSAGFGARSLPASTVNPSLPQPTPSHNLSRTNPCLNDNPSQRRATRDPRQCHYRGKRS